MCDMSSAFPVQCALSSILVPWRRLRVLLVSFCVCPTELFSFSLPHCPPPVCLCPAPVCNFPPPIPVDWGSGVPPDLCHFALWHFSTVGDVFMELFFSILWQKLIKTNFTTTLAAWLTGMFLIVKLLTSTSTRLRVEADQCQHLQ